MGRKKIKKGISDIELLNDDEIFVKLENKECKITEFDMIKDYYLISNYGRIFSVYYDRIINPFIDKDGYLRIELSVYNSKKGRKFYVHRLVAFMFVEGYFEGALVNHINSDRQCNISSNLEWVTAQENSDHAKEFGYLLLNNTSEYRNLNNVHNINTVKRVCKMISLGCDNKYILSKFDFSDKRDRKNFNTFINDLRGKRSFKWLSDRYF